MSEQETIPTLIQLMYGDKAEMAYRDASERQLYWCAAFDAWLATKKVGKTKRRWKQILRPWTILFESCGKFIWEISTPDLQAFCDRLQEKGYANATVGTYLSYLWSFFDWCIQEGVDESLIERGNPVEDVERPKVKHYSRAQIWSLEEVEALIRALDSDDSILTKRDRAMFYLRLMVAEPWTKVRTLRWGQVGQGEAYPWISWDWPPRQDRREELSQLVWEAILDYLEASGRLEGMRSETYIFAPLKEAIRIPASGRAEDWNEEKPISAENVSFILKRFGRVAGIAEEKLVIPALKHTAVFLRLKLGDDASSIHEFTKSSDIRKTTKYLDALVERAEACEAVPLQQVELPAEGISRDPYRFEEWETAKHGLHARRQPQEDMDAIREEAPEGLKDEIKALRRLAEELMALQQNPRDKDELIKLMETYSAFVGHLPRMLDAQKRLDGGSEARKEIEEDEEFWIEALKEDNWDLLADMLEPNANELVENEVISVRVVLRRTFELAMKASRKGDAAELMRLAKVYGHASGRLVHLLKAQGQQDSPILATIKAQVDAELEDFTRRWLAGEEFEVITIDPDEVEWVRFDEFNKPIIDPNFDEEAFWAQFD